MPTRFALAVAASAAALLSTLPAAAQSPAPAPATAASPVPAGSALVHVASCSTKNVNPQGGNGGIVYTNGNAGNDYWGSDVYGNTYYQPASSVQGPKIYITFTNVSNKPIKSIEFGLLLDQLLSGTAYDSGNFAPGAQVKHKLGLNMSAEIPGPSRCVPLKITFADGTKWRNPRLPAKGQASFNSKIPPKPINQ